MMANGRQRLGAIINDTIVDVLIWYRIAKLSGRHLRVEIRACVGITCQLRLRTNPWSIH